MTARLRTAGQRPDRADEALIPDTGCEFWSSCLSCPLQECPYVILDLQAEAEGLSVSYDCVSAKARELVLEEAERSWASGQAGPELQEALDKVVVSIMTRYRTARRRLSSRYLGHLREVSLGW